jgi:hypothetical protein
MPKQNTPWRAELGIRQPPTALQRNISGMFHAVYPDAAASGDPPRVFDAATGAGISRLGDSNAAAYPAILATGSADLEPC